jgi:O-acetylserine/cysteine efflux transporter
VVCALLLFLIWSNSFVAIGYLLGGERAAARFDWLGLTVGRFLPAALVAGVYVLGWRRREAALLLRVHGARVFACGLLAVPGYNFALYYGQQHGVPAPVASLTTALAPLMLMLLGRVLFQERIGARRIGAFLLALAGLALIASVPGRASARPYSLLVLVTAGAPLCWSLYSVLGKPAGSGAPVLWTLLTILVGTAPLLVVLPFRGGAELLELDAAGWTALLYLSLGCTIFGFAAWNWLLRHLPASTVGLTVFLNPPLTSLSKLALAALFPATFTFTVQPREWLGGAVVLGALALAFWPRYRR